MVRAAQSYGAHEPAVWGARSNRTSRTVMAGRVERALQPYRHGRPPGQAPGGKPCAGQLFHTGGGTNGRDHLNASGPDLPPTFYPAASTR